MRLTGLHCLIGLVSCIYLFLYVPIIVMVIFSFNSNPFTQEWSSFTTHWYYELLHSAEIWQAFGNSVLLASSAVILSISLGILFIVFCNRRYLYILQLIFYAALAVPEIVVAVALLSFFYNVHIPLSLTTLVAGHTLLGLGYVVPILYTRYLEIDMRLLEAARDLGATQWQTFYTVILPLMMPSLVSASLLVFIISLDDFLISFFCASASVQTLPLYIFSMIRAGSTPVVNALSTVLLVTSSIAVLLFSFLQFKKVGGKKA